MKSFLIGISIALLPLSAFAVTTTSTQMTVTSRTVTYGDPIDFRALLTTTTGSSVTLKHVDFYVDGVFVVQDDETSSSTTGNAIKNNVALPSGVRNVGVHTITATFAGDATYATSTNTATLTIYKRPLTVTAQAYEKTYDGTTSSSILPIITTGALQYSETSNFIQNFLSKIVGTNNTIVPSGVVNDTNAGGNYAYTFINSNNGAITSIPVSVQNIIGVSKQFDGTTVAAVNTTGASVSGVITGDDVQMDTSTLSAVFENADVGTGKTISVSGITLSGADSSNYTLSEPAGITADITSIPTPIPNPTPEPDPQPEYETIPEPKTNPDPVVIPSPSPVITTPPTPEVQVLYEGSYVSGGSSGSIVLPVPVIDGGDTFRPESEDTKPFKFTCDISYWYDFVCTTDDIKELQKLLKELGFYKGKITGKYTFTIFTAVQAYQQANGVHPSLGFIGTRTRALFNGDTS